MSFIQKLFSENSEVSMMRMLAFISLIASIILAYQQKPGFEAFIYSAFVGKAMQKFSEVKNG